MPRGKRNLGKTGWAHVILRGINRENLFFDNEDYERFISTTDRFKEESGAEIGALCLMGNHVHFLIKAENELFARIMKKIAVSYAAYYNKKYDRVGHVFQDRYRSEPVNDDRYFLTVLRYIYQNPQAAGICKAEKYPYTFIRKDGIVPAYFSSSADMNTFLNESDDSKCLEYDSVNVMSDDEAIAEIYKLTGDSNPLTVQNLDRKSRDILLRKLKGKGISIRRISRLTGINRNIIQRA